MGHLVPVEYHHLAQVADLLEAVFPTYVQEGHREFLRVLRWLAQRRAWQRTRHAGWIGEIGFKGWVWLEEEQVVGHVAMYPVRGQRACILVNLAVSEEHRRRGIGRQLVVAVLEEARRRGFDHVWLEVEAANQPARRLYQSLGFVPVTQVWRWRWSPQEESAPPAQEAVPQAWAWAQRAPLRWLGPRQWGRVYPWLRAWYPRWLDWRYSFDDLERLKPSWRNRLYFGLYRERLYAWCVPSSRGEPLAAMVWWHVRRWREQTLFLAVPCGFQEAWLYALMRPLRHSGYSRRYTFFLDTPTLIPASVFYRAGWVLWRRLEILHWFPGGSNHERLDGASQTSLDFISRASPGPAAPSRPLGAGGAPGPGSDFPGSRCGCGFSRGKPGARLWWFCACPNLRWWTRPWGKPTRPCPTCPVCSPSGSSRPFCRP